MLSAGPGQVVGRVSRLIFGLFLAVAAASAQAEYAYNFPTPATPVAADILRLHNIIMIICLVIFVVVFGFMFYSIAMHRKSLGHRAAKFHDNAVLEVAWTIIPFLILIGMAIPSTATLLTMDNTSQSELTVKITGYQWKWKYDYPDQDLAYFSTLATPRAQIENKEKKGEHYLLEVDNPLVLPVGKKVRFVITANDVIHAWWVPQLGVKKDAIPGFINESWTKINEPGTYRGQCAELCGKDHGFMPIVVNAVLPEEFDRWVVAQKDQAKADAADAANRTFAKEELMERGKKVFDTTCAACHGSKGEGVATFPKLAGSKTATGPAADHIKTVLNGRVGTNMQAFGAQLNDVSLAAVITYERNAFGNNVGDLVQPAQIKAARKK